MSYVMKKKIANKKNYGSARDLKNIKYIVIHYTGNNGDTDENNGKYFANNIVKASAHYFVDSDSITQSVPDDCIAYAVGGNYGGGPFYQKCTNANSISIELCDDIKNGVVYPSPDTIKNAIAFTKELMKKYNIKADHVIRHFDVNGKKCPAYWTIDSKWKSEFHNKLSSKMIRATATPASKSESFKGSYKCTANLNMRNGAGTSKQLMLTLPQGTKVTCDGRYTSAQGMKWMYVTAVINGITYIGFCSANYLNKIK